MYNYYLARSRRDTNSHWVTGSIIISLCKSRSVPVATAPSAAVVHSRGCVICWHTKDHQRFTRHFTLSLGERFFFILFCLTKLCHVRYYITVTTVGQQCRAHIRTCQMHNQPIVSSLFYYCILYIYATYHFSKNISCRLACNYEGRKFKNFMQVGM